MIDLLRPEHPDELASREAFYLTGRDHLTGPHVLLHTCDRTEVYSGDGETDFETARHLFEVAAGLRSPLLGEAAIQGQVKKAYQDAVDENRVSSGLHRLFQNALRVGKLVRSSTGVGKGAMSHAQGVIQVLDEQWKGKEAWRQATVAVLGVNQLTEDLLAFLAHRKPKALLLGNRTLERARDFGENFGAEVFSLDELRERLTQADAVISATSSPHLILDAGSYPDDGRPRWLFDLASPRDIDPALKNRPEVSLFNVQDIEALLADNRLNRLEEAAKARKLVEEETRKFFATHQSKEGFRKQAQEAQQ